MAKTGTAGEPSWTLCTSYSGPDLRQTIQKLATTPDGIEHVHDEGETSPKKKTQYYYSRTEGAKGTLQFTTLEREGDYSPTVQLAAFGDSNYEDGRNILPPSRFKRVKQGWVHDPLPSGADKHTRMGPVPGTRRTLPSNALRRDDLHRPIHKRDTSSERQPGCDTSPRLGGVDVYGLGSPTLSTRGRLPIDCELAPRPKRRRLAETGSVDQETLSGAEEMD